MELISLIHLKCFWRHGAHDKTDMQTNRTKSMTSVLGSIRASRKMRCTDPILTTITHGNKIYFGS